MFFHSAMRSWANGLSRGMAAQPKARRCTCEVAGTALFSADEITASVPKHRLTHRPWTAWMRRCGPRSSMSFSPWSAAGWARCTRSVLGQPTRCLLTPNPARMYSSSSFGMFKNTATAIRQNANPPQSSMAIDVGEDAISVIDLKSDARIASAPLAQVSATPAASARSVARMGVLTTAVLVVRVANSQPLTIGCPDWAGPPQAT